MFRILIVILSVSFMNSCSKEEVTSNSGNQTSLANINSMSEYDTTIITGVSMMFFHATWCSICTAQRPDVEGLSSETSIKGAKLGQVDTDKSKDIMSKYSISGQPVIVIYKEGVEKHKLLGKGHSKATLTNLIKALL